MTASSPLSESVLLAEGALIETPIDGLNTSDRRDAYRLPSVRPARAEIRRLGVGSGPDFAEELIDVSEGGIKVRFCLAVKRGDRFDVTLWGPSGEWCGRFQAVARWVLRTGPAASLAGLQLGRALPRRTVNALTSEPEFFNRKK